jgi:hypothetical protein
MSEMTMFETGNLPAFAKNRELSSLAKSLAGGGSGRAAVSASQSKAVCSA